MGLFGKDQFSSVVEWEEFRDDLIFWRWQQGELKKGSRLIIRPGQDAIFLYNGRIEGIFKDDGDYDIESRIIPFLSTLKGFKFGFNSGLRAEVLFINTKEFTLKWGTKGAINLPFSSLPGGLPVRAFGTYCIKVDDYICLLEKIAGIKSLYSVNDVRDRVSAEVNQLLMSGIVRDGKDMFDLQARSSQIAMNMEGDLDMTLRSIGLKVTHFTIENISYPEEVQAMVKKAAAQAMVGDVERYQRISMADAMASGKTSAGDMAGAAFGLAAGMNMANQTLGQNQNTNTSNNPSHNASNTDMMFCSECGSKIARTAKFCPECGFKHKE